MEHKDDQIKLELLFFSSKDKNLLADVSSTNGTVLSCLMTADRRLSNYIVLQYSKTPHAQPA